ncbi:hypothetical protein V22_02340 [Calycomorphotria hydatis]|uniref:Uncharacterized protein n=1 Tax=Calycomorphotria hydatis TaxID=2528027 RepID=A0A517T3T2_9PLAN|nr:hypothetical protein V22_02340 [Calycomorphotria hydatis]
MLGNLAFHPLASAQGFCFLTQNKLITLLNKDHADGCQSLLL